MIPKLPLLDQSSNNFFLIAGPCVIEDEESPYEICSRLKDICSRLHIPFMFKASYRKANRSSIHSFTGIGDQRALNVLKGIGEKYSVPVVTDIHSEEEAELASSYADVLQIPAFLCRQTSLLEAAAKTGKYVNIKKGQFLSPDSMAFAVEKLRCFGCEKVMLTERGTTFGYQDLVVDFRGVPIMQRLNAPVIVDATHSLQRPNQSSGVTGGDPSMIETICKAAVAVGCDGIFMETHPNPAVAKSDGANMLKLSEMESILTKLVAIRGAILQ